MHDFDSFLLFLTLLLTKLGLSNAYGYCVDAYCPLKCCQDFYTCAVTTDCQSTYKSYEYPYVNGEACGSDSDCKSDCCGMDDKCTDKSSCEMVRAIVGGVFGGIFLMISIWRIILYCRRRANREKQNSDMLKIVEKNGDNTEASSMIMDPEKEDPNKYVENKLFVLKEGASQVQGMPCKPVGGDNLIISNFKTST